MFWNVISKNFKQKNLTQTLIGTFQVHRRREEVTQVYPIKNDSYFIVLKVVPIVIIVMCFVLYHIVLKQVIQMNEQKILQKGKVDPFECFIIVFRIRCFVHSMLNM